MTFQVEDFKSSLKSGLLRPNRWEVEFVLPQGLATETAALHSSLHARTASTPPAIVGEIDMPWEGKSFYIPGDRQVNEFPVTFIGVQNVQWHTAIEEWNYRLTDPETNLQQTDLTNLLRTVKLTLLNTQNVGLKQYVLEHAFPREVGEISLDMDSKDSASTFTVTFRYSTCKRPTTL